LSNFNCPINAGAEYMPTHINQQDTKQTNKNIITTCRYLTTHNRQAIHNSMILRIYTSLLMATAE
jgi:glutaminase